MDAKGELQEKVYDVVWSGDRKPGADGKLPSVGNTVDVANAIWTNTIGAPELIAVWKDPDFDAAAARLLLRPRHRDSDAALDGLRRQALRHQAAAGHADDGHRARLHLADLVHAGMMKRLLREPLLHFLLLGAVLFAAHGILARGGGSEPGRIVVTRGQIESMAMLFSRTWQRPPSDEELQGLIRSHVREEVLYREGVALGLDRDDPIVRRRVAQKLEFVTEHAEAVEPSDGDLQAYLDLHPAVFAAEPKITFRHIYLDPRRREKTLASDAQRMLGELNRPGRRDRCHGPGRSHHASA